MAYFSRYIILKTAQAFFPIFFLNFSPLQAKEAPLPIVGWPLLALDQKLIPEWLGNEPVVGRLICPPFSRLNLKKQSSEGLIFNRVKVKAGKNKGEVLWKYRIKTGIYWWNGEKVTSADIADFFKREMQNIVQQKGSNLWALPPFAVTSKPLQVTVIWNKEPAFGPYLFNGVSLSRPKTSKNPQDFQYECVGVYQPQIEKTGILLNPNKNYGRFKKPLMLHFADSAFPATTKKGLRFNMPDDFSMKASHIRKGKAPTCSNSVELPFLTIISWNLKNRFSSKSQLRKIFTNLTPRGALLRAGAGSAGELLSSLIPRSHPGYLKTAYVRPFSLQTASEQLNKLKFTRPQGDQERFDQRKQVLRLQIMSTQAKFGILEKVLSDSFMSVGINTTFIPKNSQRPQDVDGILTGVYLPWPDMNFLEHFHSSKPDLFPFWPLGRKKLDTLLEEYAKSLSQFKPDFNILKKIHRELYTLEPVTVIMQHKACLSAGNRKMTRIDHRDPDWFRKMIM